MKRAWKIALTASLAASLSAPLVADDDQTRFERGGFLKSLDAFIAEQMAKQRAGNKLDRDAALKELQLSLRDKKQDDDSFFRLSDSRNLPVYQPGSLSEKPDLSSLLAPTGQLRGAYGINQSGANSRLDLSFGRNKNDANSRGFEVSFESAYRYSVDALPATSDFSDLSTANREYNLGVTLGYSGFGIDASMTREKSVFKPELSGFDVGFSYRSTTWAARLSMSEYQAGADLFGIENDVRSIISVELGASYRLTERIGFKGGVRYYDYGDQWVVVDPEAGENSQMIFLGGQLKF